MSQAQSESVQREVALLVNIVENGRLEVETVEECEAFCREFIAWCGSGDAERSVNVLGVAEYLHAIVNRRREELTEHLRWQFKRDSSASGIGSLSMTIGDHQQFEDLLSDVIVRYNGSKPTGHDQVAAYPTEFCVPRNSDYIAPNPNPVRRVASKLKAVAR